MRERLTSIHGMNKSELLALLERLELHPSRRLGQNFLIDPNMLDSLVRSAGVAAGDRILEIGPGIGCLTVQLSRRAGKVLSVELDKTLMPILSETLAGCDNTEVLFADVLKLDLEKTVREDFAGLRPVVCANLPYNITSPVLTKLVSSGFFDQVTVMIQREVARRICAGPGESDYSAFGILMQWYTETKILFDVPPSSFVPQPKVTSSVISLHRREKPPVSVQDEKLLFTVVRAAFNQRRKTLVNALASGIGWLDKEAAEQAISSCGLDVRVRGEALSIEAFARLSDVLSDLRER